MARWHSHPPLRRWAALAAAPVAALLAIEPGIAPAGLAIPRLDLSPYPKPAPGERRWVIQLPGVLPPTPAGAPASDPRSWGVQLVVGEEMPVDCNIRRISGQLRASDVPGWGYPIYRLEGPNAGLAITTLMACPPGQPKPLRFVTLAGDPVLAPYNVSLPIVVYLPERLELRWRVWRPLEPLRPARAL
jgi:ecotin